MHWGEDASEPTREGRSEAPARLPAVMGVPRGWRRWIANARRRPVTAPADPSSAPDPLDLHTTLRALPTALDGASLPNGIVELLIEDFEAPTRQLFDIHDGRIALVAPGAAVPWASIAGPPTAWAMALGPERDVAGLRLTGDQRLARRVLAAIPSNG